MSDTSAEADIPLRASFIARFTRATDRLFHGPLLLLDDDDTEEQLWLLLFGINNPNSKSREEGIRSIQDVLEPRLKYLRRLSVPWRNRSLLGLSKVGRDETFTLQGVVGLVNDFLFNTGDPRKHFFLVEPDT